MTLNFNEPELHIGNALTPPLEFFRRGFNLGGSGSSPEWKDIILKGNTALTLANAKANGINYVKLFGACEQTGTPTPNNPIDIVCNNGAIKYSLNELNPNAVECGYYRVTRTGEKTVSPSNFLTDFMPIKPNTSYVCYGRRRSDNHLSQYNRIYWFDSNKTFISTCDYSENTVTVATSPQNAYYAQAGINESGGTSIPTTQEIVDSYNWVFQEGTSEVPYQPYIEGGIYVDGTVETVEVDTTGDTATAEMLLGVGDYKDVQNVTNGNITRNVGIKVLDGTEGWSRISDSRYQWPLSTSIGGSSDYPVMCTHLKYSQTSTSNDNIRITAASYVQAGLSYNTTLDNWKKWLKDQYDANTPVIFIYCLKNPTTETVAGQHLGIQAGTNAVEITQASINNLPLEVSYKGKEGE